MTNRLKEFDTSLNNFGREGMTVIQDLGSDIRTARFHERFSAFPKCAALISAVVGYLKIDERADCYMVRRLVVDDSFSTKELSVAETAFLPKSDAGYKVLLNTRYTETGPYVVIIFVNLADGSMYRMSFSDEGYSMFMMPYEYVGSLGAAALAYKVDDYRCIFDAFRLDSGKVYKGIAEDSIPDIFKIFKRDGEAVLKECHDVSKASFKIADTVDIVGATLLMRINLALSLEQTDRGWLCL